MKYNIYAQFCVYCVSSFCCCLLVGVHDRGNHITSCCIRVDMHGTTHTHRHKHTIKLNLFQRAQTVRCELYVNYRHGLAGSVCCCSGSSCRRRCPRRPCRRLAKCFRINSLEIVALVNGGRSVISYSLWCRVNSPSETAWDKFI